MKPCKQCKNKIPNSIVINGKRRFMQNRQFCLKCSPFGLHNTSKFQPRKIPCDLSVNSNKRSKWRLKYGSQYVLKKRQDLKLKLFLYKGGKCETCLYDKPIMRAYAFHHKNPKLKDFGIAQSGRSFESMKKEVDKCKLLCVRCHAEEHFIAR